jgi:hypothetical protein
MKKVLCSFSQVPQWMLLTLFALVFTFSVLQTTPEAHALVISPVRIEQEADKGTTINAELTLVNDQKEQKTFYTSSENFEAKGEGGTPNFVISNEGLSSWVTIDKEVTLAPGEQRTVPFTIKIPQDATPGGYFAAVFLNTTPPSTNAGEVAVGAKIGVLLLIRVSGDIKESAGIASYQTIDGANFYSELPVGLTYRFNNQGGDRVQPKGTITIKHLFGWTSATLDANAEEGNILPNSTRKFEAWWGDKARASGGFFSDAWYQAKNFSFGKYTATLDLVYGSKDTQASQSLSFWIIPWQLLLFVFLVLIVGFLLLRKIITTWDRFIIKQAEHALEAKMHQSDSNASNTTK